MSSARRIFLRWCLLALFVAGCVWWSIWEPYDPAAVYRAIPAGAWFVSAHQNLGGRWRDLCRSPLVRACVTAAGVEPEDLRTALRDPDAAVWARRLAARETVFAYVPAGGGFARPAWVFASWAGGYGRRLRWLHAAGLVKGWHAARPRRGIRLWCRRFGEETDPRAVSVALEGGVLLGCISEDPLAAAALVSRGGSSRRPGSATVEFPAAAGKLPPSSSTPDRAWVRLGRMETEPRGALAAVAVALEEWTPSRTTGRLCWPWELTAAGGRTASETVWQPSRLFGVGPEAVLAFGAGHAAALIGDGSGTNRLESVLQPVLEALESSTPCFVALLAGEYSGRVHGGLKVPTLLIGVEVADEAAAARLAAEAIDAVNIVYQLGVIPRPIETYGHPAFVLDGTGGSGYDEMLSTEKAAFLYLDGWLVAASNVRTLSLLMAARDSGGNTNAVVAGPRLDGAAVCFQADAGAAAAAAAHGLAVWEMTLPWDSPARQRSREIRGVLRLFLRARRLDAGLRFTNGVAEAEFVLSE